MGVGGVEASEAGGGGHCRYRESEGGPRQRGKKTRRRKPRTDLLRSSRKQNTILGRGEILLLLKPVPIERMVREPGEEDGREKSTRRDRDLKEEEEEKEQVSQVNAKNISASEQATHQGPVEQEFLGGRQLAEALRAAEEGPIGREDRRRFAGRARRGRTTQERSATMAKS